MTITYPPSLVRKDHLAGPENEMTFPQDGALTDGKGAVQHTYDGVAFVVNTVEGLTAYNYGDGVMNKLVLVLDGVVVSTLDNGTAGAGGSVTLGTLPKGLIQFLSSSMFFSSLTSDGTGLVAAQVLDIGVGTTAADSTTVDALSTVAQQVCNKDDLTLSSLSLLNQFQGTVLTGSATSIDGSTTAATLYLNVCGEVATSAADGTLTVSGRIEINYVNAGKAA